MSQFLTRKTISQLLRDGVVGSSVEINGWIRTRRDAKEMSFLEVNDGSCLANIQIIVDRSISRLDTCVQEANTGAAVQVEGELVLSPAKGQRVEVKATSLNLIGPADANDYPLQKKRHSFEFLRTIAHLRPRTNTFGAVFRLRHAAAFAIHKFFHDRGFVCVHTPIITTSDCEGAGKMFRVTTLDPTVAISANVEDKNARETFFSNDFFGREASLSVSGQLEAELFATALSKVYTFGPTFRAENSNTPRHLAEFWMVEPEMAFCDLQGDMEVAEDFVRSVIQYVLENCQDDMKFFDQWVEKGIINSLEQVASAKFEVITYTEAINCLAKCGRSFEYPISWGADIQTEHERYLTEEYIGRPVFVTNYPKEIKAFYMRLDEGEKTVSAMDLLVPRLGEIIGGSQREDRKDVLLKRLAESGLDENNYWWYLDLRRYGSVPHAGFGLGFERLLMYLSGMSNIRDVIPFPRTPGNANF